MSSSLESIQSTSRDEPASREVPQTAAPTPNPELEILAALSRSCRECEPQKVLEVRRLALFAKSLGAASAATLIDEKMPCTHPEVRLSDELDKALALTAYGYGFAVLSRQYQGKSAELEKRAGFYNYRLKHELNVDLRLSEKEVGVVNTGLKHLLGYISANGQLSIPKLVKGGYATDHGFTAFSTLDSYLRFAQKVEDEVYPKPRYND